jgi:hypothetical protein
MVSSQLAFLDGKRSLIEGFCGTVVALVTVEFCQVVEALGHIRMVSSKESLTDFQGALSQRSRRFVLSLLVKF